MSTYCKGLHPWKLTLLRKEQGGVLSVLQSTADVRNTLLGKMRIIRKLPTLNLIPYAEAYAQHAAQMSCMSSESLTYPQPIQQQKLPGIWGIAFLKELSLV